MHIESTPTPEREARTGTFMVEADHPGTMRRTQMGRQVQLLLDLDPANISTNSEFQELHPLAKPGDFMVFVQSYLDYLQSEVTDESLLEAKAAAIERYDTEFKEIIEQTTFLRSEKIGSGRSSDAHVIHVDDTPYVVRLISENDDVREVDKHFSASERVKGIDHMEHIVAISYRNGNTVAPFIPGENFRNLAASELELISKEQITEFYQSMKEAYQNGVYFDAYGDNLLYDSEVGFTAVDLSATQDGSHSDPADALQQAVSRMVYEWSHGKDGGSRRGIELARLLHIVEEVIASDLPTASVTKIQDVASNLHAQITHYQAFEKSIAAHEAAKRSA